TTAPARPNLPRHGLKKPEIAYLPAAGAGNSPVPRPTVFSCCRPHMEWQSCRFEGQTQKSPHILVYDVIPRELIGHVVFVHPISSWPGLTRSSTSLVARSPDRARPGPRLSGDGIEASSAYFNSTLAP